jgi:hypothetical protein
MPKDKNLAKHKSRFEVRGGVINEFDFHRNQGALAEEERDRFARQEDERRVREGEAEATEAAPQAAKKARTAAKSAASSTKKKEGTTKAATGAQNAAAGAGKKSAKKTGGAKPGSAGKATGKKS